MKHLICAGMLVMLITVCAFAQPATSTYTRDGAKATMKYTSILFEDPFLFTKGAINIPGDKGEMKPAVLEALAESDKVIKEYEAKIEEFIKSKPTAIILKNAYSDVTRHVNGLQHAIKSADDGFNNWRSFTAVSFLQDLYLYQTFIACAMKVYPEAISLEERLDEAKAAIAKYGSREDYIAKMEKNKVDYLKNIRMKKAVFSDAGVEASAKKQYETSWAADKVTVTKVNITTNWVIEKNVLDIPLHKEAEVNFAIKKADGTCAIASGYMRCTYEGGGKYSAPMLIMPTGPITIPCENLNK
jgi:hypothetical protein